MLATFIHGDHDIRIEKIAKPVLVSGDDAIVRVVAACVCGSDLWPYRGVTPTTKPRAIGHEFVGIVESIGADVHRQSRRLRHRAVLQLRYDVCELRQWL